MARLYRQRRASALRRGEWVAGTRPATTKTDRLYQPAFAVTYGRSFTVLVGAGPPSTTCVSASAKSWMPPSVGMAIETPAQSDAGPKINGSAGRYYPWRTK